MSAHVHHTWDQTIKRRDNRMAEARKPKVGMTVAVRQHLGVPVKAGIITSLTTQRESNTGQTETVPLEDGVVHVSILPGSTTIPAKYFKGAEFVQTWCWPEEVE
jgi:hypothetical protein